MDNEGQLMLRHYRNEVIKPGSFSGIGRDKLADHLRTEIVEEKVYTGSLSSVVLVDTGSLEMSLYFEGTEIGRYPVNISRNPCSTPHGAYIVMEKWEKPYQKRGKMYFLPGQFKHRIGKRLIILYDPDKQKKLEQAIHESPIYPLNSFRPGRNSNGCVRMRRDDLHDFFSAVELGAMVFIK